MLSPCTTIEGQPPDVVAIVTEYRAALCRSPLPKLLFAVDPRGLAPAPVIAWCRANLPNLEVVELGAGRHFIQEDHPHAVGSGLASWLRRLASA